MIRISTAALISIALLGQLSQVAAQTVSLTTLYNFTGVADGGLPEAGVVVGSGGVLFGTTGCCGMQGSGTVFSLTPPASPGGAWTQTVLHNFGGTAADGQVPYSGVTIGPRGILFGTTGFGGEYSQGTVFAVGPPTVLGGSWKEAVLHSFGGTVGDGQVPYAGVILGPRGTLYGTTQYGGTYGAGTVFALTPPASPGESWTEHILYSFSGTDDGNDPLGSLTSIGGILYGTTASGGTFGSGTVFSLTPPASGSGSWTQIVIHSFGGDGDGSSPLSGLIAERGGVLYGSTQSGGKLGGGTVFSLTPPTASGGAWTETLLHHFASGGSPQARLVLDRKTGVIYGTTSGGGTAGDGTVFRLGPPKSAQGIWSQTVFHNFTGEDGSHPFCNGGLVLDNGMLYGTTFEGGTYGPNGPGTVFQLAP